VNKQLAMTSAARFAAAKVGVPFEGALGTAHSLASTGGVGVDVSTATGRAPLPTGFSYTAPSNLVLFVFITSLAAAALIVNSRPEDQAGAMGPASGIALGMLCGCMWPLVIVPPIMRAVGHGTPQAWAMDGFIALIARNAHVNDVAGSLLALTVFAVVLLTAGA